MVCGCLAVNRGTLTQAQLKGCTTVSDLTRQTGAGSMCGSCKPLLADLLGVDENAAFPMSMPISMPLGQISVRDRVPVSRRDRAPASRHDEAPRSRRGGSPRSVRGLAMLASGGLTSPLGPRSARTSFLGLPTGSDQEIADDLDLGDRRSSIPPVGRISSIPPVGRTSSIPPADRTSSIPPADRTSSIPPLARAEGLDSDAPARHSRTSVKPHPPVLDHDDASPDSHRTAPESEERAHPMPDEDGYQFEDGDDDEPDRDSYSEGRRSWVPPTRLSAPPARISVVPPPPKAAAPPERGIRVLFVASFAAAVLAVMTLAWPSAQAARSVHEISPLEPLWTDSTWKQVSGYALLGLCAVSLLFSARKRIPWFTFSDVPIWRMIHGVLGALTLTTLAMHTGLHLGSHLILVLTLDFLAAILLGAAAGAITFWSTGWGAVTARNRRLSSARVHLLVCWPLPILIVLHVLQTYFY
jgi:bacterioferritin-associated ferredoxin